MTTGPQPSPSASSPSCRRARCAWSRPTGARSASSTAPTASCYAIEDRCSHDDGPLAEGEFDAASCTVECPRHGSLFDLTDGQAASTLPAYRPVDTFEVRVDDDEVKLEL